MLSSSPELLKNWYSSLLAIYKDKRQQNAENKKNAGVVKNRPGSKKSSSKDKKKDIKAEISFKRTIELNMGISLISNPSPSAVMKKIIQKMMLTNRENTLILRNTSNADKEGDDSDSSHDKNTSPVHIARVVEIGLSVVFELVSGSRITNPLLCCRALQALLDTLQGQNLEALKNEPQESLEKLYSILLELTVIGKDTDSKLLPTENHLALQQIPSLACSCLISLILAWGNTGKLLAALSAMLIDSSLNENFFVQVPAILIKLQNTVLGSSLGSTHMLTPLQIGILEQTKIMRSQINDPSFVSTSIKSIACDGSYIYCLLGNGEIVKIGTGYDGTIIGSKYGSTKMEPFVETSESDIASSSSSASFGYPSIIKMLYCEGYLYVITNNSTVVLDSETLTVQDTGTQLQQQFVKRGVWSSDGRTFSHLYLNYKDTFQLQSYSINEDKKMVAQGHPLSITPVQTHIIAKGELPKVTKTNLDSILDSNCSDIVDIACGKDFQLYLLATGQVLYTGKPEALGIKKQPKKTSQPRVLGVPRSTKIKFIAAAPNGDHAILVGESGESFFVGTPNRGENGVSVKSQKVIKPQRVRKMACMESKNVILCACNAGTTALVTKEGRIYMFGKDSVHVESKTGLVTALKAMKTTQIAMGKAHIVALLNDGKVYTFGVNNKGQCGRQDPNLSIYERIAEVKSEKDVSMHEEDKSACENQSVLNVSNNWQNMVGSSSNAAPICSPTKHKWSREECRICAVCQECTGYGSRCINSGTEQRIPGLPCGCGAGDSGCSECKCCKTCAEEADVKTDFENRDMGSEADILKESSKIAMLPPCHVVIGVGKDSDSKAIQVACGSHHSVVLLENGSVYTFGQNQHGQLGLGDKTMRNHPCKVKIEEQVTSVAVGSYHTLMLTKSGRVYVCGKWNGELGVNEAGSPEKEATLFPKPLNLPSRITWIQVCHEITFIKFEKLLLSKENLERAHVCANQSYLAVIDENYDFHGNEEQRNTLVILIDKADGACYHFDKNQFKLTPTSSLCLDPRHDIMWSIDYADWSIQSLFVHGVIKHTRSSNDSNKSSMNPFSPQLAIPLVPETRASRHLVAVNILSCIDTLVKTCPPGGTKHLANKMELMDLEGFGRISPIRFLNKQSDTHTFEDYSIVQRFKSNGGGWGYSAQSIEAIRFSCNADVLIGGCGVFGGRGEYTIKVRMYEDSSADIDGDGADGQLIVETDNLPYECGFREKFHVLFEEPILISAGQSYTITAKITGPSSDCGSHGEPQVITDDNVKFNFRRSKISNNGTDVAAGQIPELLYTLPPAENALSQSQDADIMSQCITAQLISEEFFNSVSQNTIQSLLSLLNWSWGKVMSILESSISVQNPSLEENKTKDNDMSEKIHMLSFICVFCLRLLRTSILKIRNEHGSELGEYGQEIAHCSEMISHILTDKTIDIMFQSNDVSAYNLQMISNSVSIVLWECHETVGSCIDAFYSSPIVKWNQLNFVLESYHKCEQASIDGISRLLSVLLDSLCQPSVDLVQCLPLFPRTLSNLQSLKSHSNSPMNTDHVFTTSGDQLPSMLNQKHLNNDISIGSFQDLVQSIVEIITCPVRNMVESWTIKNEGNEHPGLDCPGSDVDDDELPKSLLHDAQKSLISSACRFLIALVQELSFKTSEIPDSNSQLMGNKHDEYFVANRFMRPVGNRCWNTGNGSPDAVCFSVSRSGVSLVGFGIYGGGGDHTYEMEVMQQMKGLGESLSETSERKVRWETLELAKGIYRISDCDSNNIANILFDKPVTLKENQVYAVRLHNHGERTYCGEQGSSEAKGQDGTEFRITSCALSSNGTSVMRGQIPTILYTRQASEDEFLGSPNNDWIGTATTTAKSQATYLKQTLYVLGIVSESSADILQSLTQSSEPENLSKNTKPMGPSDNDTDQDDTKEQNQDESSLELSVLAEKILMSHLMSDLLPKLFESVGILAHDSPKCAFDVLGVAQQLLPPVISSMNLTNCDEDVGEDQGGELKSPTEKHLLVVESDHPYKPATFMEYKASFPDSVNCMVLEFHPKSQTAQPEDVLQLYLPVRENTGSVPPSPAKLNQYPVLEKMFQSFNWPKNAVIIPGNEVVFSLATASDYSNKRDQKPELFYGFHCTVTGFEMSMVANRKPGEKLVSDITSAAGISCVTLMKAHEELAREPFTAESSSSFPDSLSLLTSLSKDELNNSVKRVEDAAQATLERHQFLFRYGIDTEVPVTPTQALTGDIQLSSNSREKRFLLDFISATPNSSGGRLARWLQPDSYVDPEHCSISLDQRALFATVPISITIVTKDQYGNTVNVPALAVELSAKPLPMKDKSPSDMISESFYDVSPNEVMQLLSTSYEPTKHRDSIYHSISMMRSYRKYSFEELHILHPLKPVLKNESMLVTSVGKGVYTATWIPVHATNYLLKITFDRELKGPRKHVVVAPPPCGVGHQVRLGTQLLLEQNKRLKFEVKNSNGLRIRSSPMLQSPQVGLLKFNDVIDIEEELRNTDGLWVKLSKKSIEKFCKPSTLTEAWSLQFHNHCSKVLLVPVKPEENLLKEKTQEPNVPVVVLSSAPAFKVHPNSVQKDSDVASSSTIWGSPPRENEKCSVEPGQFLVIKCGLSGHNVRCGPSLKDAVIGKLNLGDQVNIVEVVAVDSCTWLRLDIQDCVEFCVDSGFCKENKPVGWVLESCKKGAVYLQQHSRHNVKNVFGQSTPSQINPFESPQEKDSSFRFKTTDPISGEMADQHNVARDDVPSQNAGRIAEITPFQPKPQMKSNQGAIKSADAERSSPGPKRSKKPMHIKDEMASRGRSSAVIKHKQLQIQNKSRSHSTGSKNPQSKYSDALKKRSPKQSSIHPVENVKRAGHKLNARSQSAGSFRQSPVSNQQHTNPNSSNTRSRWYVAPETVESNEAKVHKTIRGGQRSRNSNSTDPSIENQPNSGAINGSGNVQTPQVANGNIDIPFIDELVDEEGNITSPSLSDVSKNEDVTLSATQSKSGKIREKEDSRPFGMAQDKNVENLREMESVWQRVSPLFSSSPRIKSDNPRPSPFTETPEALSPLVAECSRAVFAAFLWHEGIVHDAMTCATYLKFAYSKTQNRKDHDISNLVFQSDEFKSPFVTKRRRAHTVSSDSLKTESDQPRTESNTRNEPPSTLNHLFQLWQDLSSTVTKLAMKNQILPSPVTPKPNLNSADGGSRSKTKSKTIAMDVNAKSSKKKKEIPKSNLQLSQILLGSPSRQGNAGSKFAEFMKQQKVTKCELCEGIFPYPVTYHMKQAHKGCGKFASGLGYNSSGHYCGGWAGDCGDGGVGASTWYLLCVKCREKHSKSRWDQRSPQVVDKNKEKVNKFSQEQENHPQQAISHQTMKDNALFLLDLVSSSKEVELLPKGDAVNESVEFLRKSSFPRSLSTLALNTFPKIPCAYIQQHRMREAEDVFDQNWVKFQDQPSPSINRGSSHDRDMEQNDVSIPSSHSHVMRSISTGSHSEQRSQKKMASSFSAGPSIFHQPSVLMQKLMQQHNNSNKNTSSDCDVRKSSVLSFLMQQHDLKSLRFSLHLSLRRAVLRFHALQALNWLLCSVNKEQSIHDILWYFVASLSSSTTNNEEDKLDEASRIDQKEGGMSFSEDDSEQENKPLCVHPVTDLSMAGEDGLQSVAEAFHSVLQTVSSILLQLPQNSRAQLMAIRCWSIRVLPSDHHFLHSSHIFSHISKILSKSDNCGKSKEVTHRKLFNVKSGIQKIKTEKGCTVSSSNEITNLCSIHPSSHDSIVGSLTDGTTETFWESGEKDKNKAKFINITFDPETVKENELIMEKVLVHIDNTRDIGKKVSSISFKLESSGEVNDISSHEVNGQFAGWIGCIVNETSSNVKKLRIDLKGLGNTLRIRQLKILGRQTSISTPVLNQQSSSELMSQKCEMELLRVFKLLTAEVFGQLLWNNPATPSDGSNDVAAAVNEQMNKANSSEKSAVTPNSVPSSPKDVGDENLREHMVGILFSGSKLSKLQKQMFSHIAQAITVESSCMRKNWECRDVQKDSFVSDIYCFQLLSMVLALSGSEVGRNYVAKQKSLVFDFVSMLHTGTPRIQRQVCSLLRRILPQVSPSTFAEITSSILPPVNILEVEFFNADEPKVSEHENGVLDVLLMCISKALDLQIKDHSNPKFTGIKSDSKQHSSLRMEDIEYKEGNEVMWWMAGEIHDISIPVTVIKLLTDMSKGNMGQEWKKTTKAYVGHNILTLLALSDSERSSDKFVNSLIMWKAVSSLCILDQEHVVKLSSANTVQQKEKLTCDNHDDGMTAAVIKCNVCGNLCADCDRFLHLHRRTNTHERQLFKHEEQAIQVDLHEGCGRIKLHWLMALADSKTLKAVVEFRRRAGPDIHQSTITSGICRFCGNMSDTGSLAVGNVCEEPECQQHAKNSCDKVLACGHLCGGIKDEEACLPCLHSSCTPGLKQDADDMCMVCFTDALSNAPALQLSCEHIFHFHCCKMQLEKRWSGPRITFGFTQCSICKTMMENPALESILNPIKKMITDVERKALLRLEYEGLKDCEAITLPGGRFYKDPVGFALNKYAYYLCCKCEKAYYGGEVRCDVEAGAAVNDQFNPNELICGACSDVSCAQICPKHGTDFLEYKCRYCCSVAVYFCFGTTHFCQPCHDDFQRITAIPKSNLPHCPAGPRSSQLPQDACPLHVDHPPTGEEFALGCGICRNAHTF